MWQGMIPQSENPHIINPDRGFVSSANQVPTDSTYPYYIGGGFPNYRGWIINKRLSSMADITPQDMQELQTNNYNVFAEMARPVLASHMKEAGFSADEKKYWDIFKEWNLRSDTGETAPIVFDLFWDAFEQEVWSDEAATIKAGFARNDGDLLEGIIKDSAYIFLDNINTPQKETLADNILAAYKKAVPKIKAAIAEGKNTWAKFKDTHVDHLLKLPALSRLHLPIGGGHNIINAAGPNHGPSWRMVVSLTAETEAYGVYPGGQNGNPGSKYYDNFIDNWANGKYYALWVMKQQELSDKRVKYKMRFSKL
jgi:penicillin amidase